MKIRPTEPICREHFAVCMRDRKVFVKDWLGNPLEYSHDGAETIRSGCGGNVRWTYDENGDMVLSKNFRPSESRPNGLYWPE